MKTLIQVTDGPHQFTTTNIPTMKYAAKEKEADFWGEKLV